MLDTMIAPEPFDEDFLKKAKKLRDELEVPDELDTPYFVARFLRANNGDVETTRNRINEFLTHRKCLGYGELDQLAMFTKSHVGRDTFERFGISLLQPEATSKNVHVWVHKMVDTDLKEIIKVIPLSHILHSYFMLQDLFGRCVAATEKKTGKPASVVCVLDLEGFNISDFLNPLSAQVKIARLVVQIWADYFSENMCKLIVINPPALVNIMWQIAKWILDSRTQNRLMFLRSGEDLLQYLDEAAIPEDFGGTRRDDSGFAQPASSCCRQPKLVSSSEYREHDAVWNEHGLSKPSSKSYHIKGKHHVDIERHASQTGRLVWQFTTGSDLQFEVLKKTSNGEFENVWPKFTVTSLKVPEYGSVNVDKGDYVLRFANPAGSWLPVKLHCAAEITNQ